MLMVALRCIGILFILHIGTSYFAAADDREKNRSPFGTAAKSGEAASGGSPSECDQLAGNRYHPETIGVGVGSMRIQPERAIAICESEVHAAPKAPRLRYQLGRALLAGRHFERARAELEQGVKLGDGHAMLLLATMLQRGVAGGHDHEQAASLAKRAAEAGLPSALSRLSYYYRNAIGVPYDLEQAYEYAKKAAEAGWVDGMGQLSIALTEGAGTSKNADEANRWSAIFAARARSIAESGDGFAMRQLGYAFSKGWGGPVDHVAAVNWYRKALDAGDPFSLHSLGWVHERGLGVTKNETAACDFYERSAAIGESASLNNFALCYERGTSRTVDLAKALKLFEAARLGGNAYASRSIGRFYRHGRRVATDLAKAALFYRESALRGLPAGMLDYGVMLIKGEGVERDLSGGCDWFAKAARRGHARSINNLGICYLSGEGRQKDAARGVALLEQAVALDDDLAIRNLARRLLAGMDVTRDYERGIALLRRSAEAGSHAGMVDYGTALLVAKTSTKDTKAGCEMLKKAADDDVAGGMFGYGYCLENGLTGRKRPKDALTYYERAGASHHQLAILAAARLLDEGIAGKPDGTKAAFWLRNGLATGDTRLASNLISTPHAWSLSTRRALQRLLKSEGHYAGTVDGRFTAQLDEVLWSPALIKAPAEGDKRLIQEIVRVPEKGAEHGIVVRLCRSGSVKARALVVINHGATNQVKQRRETRATACGELAQFFTDRGYIVAFPLRRGYGETGGALTELDRAGCKSGSNLARGGREIAKDIRTVINHLSAREAVSDGDTLVIGHSGGGWGVLALAGNVPKGIAGIVNISGAYLSRRGLPSTYCGDMHVTAAASFGRAVTVPSLWIYVENDSYVEARVARQMHAAFARGGSKSELVVLPKFRAEGHYIFQDGAVDAWGPAIDKWLNALTPAGVAERH